MKKVVAEFVTMQQKPKQKMTKVVTKSIVTNDS